MVPDCLSTSDFGDTPEQVAKAESQSRKRKTRTVENKFKWAMGISKYVGVWSAVRECTYMIYRSNPNFFLVISNPDLVPMYSHFLNVLILMVSGSPYVYWFGPQPRICIFDYELVKQVLANKYGHFIKNDTHPTILAMIGKGLVLVDGSDWVRHRRVVNPAFAMDKLKVTVCFKFSLKPCNIC